MLQVKSTGKRVDDTEIMRTSSGNPSSTVNSENTSDSVPAMRQSGEHSSCATDSVDRFCGNRETDAEHQEDPEAHWDHPSYAETVPTIQEIQKIVEVSQVYCSWVRSWGCPLWWKARTCESDAQEDLKVVTDLELWWDCQCSHDGAASGSHSSSVSNGRCRWFRCVARWPVKLPQAQHTVKERGHCGCETTPSNSHPDSPGDGRGSSDQRLKFDRVADVTVETQRRTAEDPMFRWTQSCVCKNTIAHDTQMVIRCWWKSCVLVKGTIRMDQPVVDRMQSRSAQQTSSSVVAKPGGAMNHRSGVYEWRLKCGRQWWGARESAWIARVRNEFQDVTATDVEHHSMLSTRAKISSLCQRGVRKDQNIVKKVALETAKIATEEFTVSLSEVVLRSQSEYGQMKSVKTRLPQRGRHVIRWRYRTGEKRDRWDDVTRPMTICSSKLWKGRGRKVEYIVMDLGMRTSWWILRWNCSLLSGVCFSAWITFSWSCFTSLSRTISCIAL